MAGKYVLAIDAGSGGCRALVIDLRGKLIASAAQYWGYYVPDDAAPMGKEFDPGAFWDIICRLVAEAIKKSGVAPKDIAAVSAASQRQGAVFLDRAGGELYAGPNTDIRAIVEGFAIDNERRDDVYAITGHAPSLIFVPARLQWFKANRPEVYKRIATALSISDWIAFRLSGRRVGEASNISGIGLLDVHDLKGPGRSTEICDLPAGVCPRIAAAGTRIGAVTAAASEQSGLAPGTPVVAGGADTQCGLLGMGVTAQGQVGIVAGWSGSVQMVTPRAVIDPKGRTWTTCHVLPGKWVVDSNAQQSGGAYRWLKDTLFEGVEDGQAYAEMDRLAENVPPGAGGALAFIGPTVMDMTRMRITFGGFIFPVTPSVTDIKRGHLVRAALENLSFAFKGNCDQLEEITQLRMRDVSIGGGLAQSQSLIRILPSVLGMPVTAFEVPNVTSWGTAMCAAVGAGLYRDLEQASEAMRPKSRVMEPDPESAEAYKGYYQKWLTAAKWLDDLGQTLG